MPDTSQYDWTEDSEALSITLVRGLDDDAVLSQLNIRRISEQPMTFDSACAEFSELITDGAYFVQIDHVDGWTVFFEDNGYKGSWPDNLDALSAAGRAINVHWNVNGVTSFGYAVDGSIVRHFDPSGINGSEGPDHLPRRARLAASHWSEPIPPRRNDLAC
jgi:hypothetical protein